METPQSRQIPPQVLGILVQQPADLRYQRPMHYYAHLVRELRVRRSLELPSR